MTRQKVMELRALIVKAAKSLADADAFHGKELFDFWTVDTAYAVGDRRRYGEELYKCLTTHISQETWKPDVSPSLWVRIDDPSVEWPDWIQPTGATDAYAKGAKVSHLGKHWVSDYDNNVWEPSVFGWSEV